MRRAFVALCHKTPAVPASFHVCLGVEARRFPLIATRFKKADQLALGTCIERDFTGFQRLCRPLRVVPVVM
jgi:hypothetical protein